MSPKISVVICTHNPAGSILQRVLDSIAAQSLDRSEWELVIVDSASSLAVSQREDIRFPSDTRHVCASKPGLAFARVLGSNEARCELVASLDDDTVLQSCYLEEAVRFLDDAPEIAAISGRVIPEYEVAPPEWLSEFGVLLAIRDLGDSVIKERGLLSGDKISSYPVCGTLGVNVARRSALDSYRTFWLHDARHQGFGRSGQSLDSGEDNDFALCVLRNGGGLAYVPTLEITHIIPSKRFAPDYLERLQRASSKTWVQVLALHGICPWTPISACTVWLRSMKAWFQCRAWRGSAERIRWQGRIGTFEGLASLKI